MSAVERNYSKKGSVDLRRTKVVKVFQYKTREIVVHPTLLSYFQKDHENVQDVIGRAFDQKRDFLLAPVGFTEIHQVKEDLLVLVSKRQKVTSKRQKATSKRAGNVSTVKEPIAFQQLTLRFASREERDDWMKVIIAECDKVYLTGLIEPTLYFAGKFVEAAHGEIWRSILLGDESLRKAYIAPAGSDHIELVRFVLEDAIVWLRELLGVAKLVPLHRKVFVALLSLMLEDAAARALFLLMRPKSGFLLEFKADTAAGVYLHNGPDDARQVAALESCAAALSFVECIKERLQSSGWKQYRTFLAVIDHPAMPLRVDSNAEYEEVQADPTDELAWLDKSRSLITEFTWETMKNATSDTPYLSYYFIMKEVEDAVDDERVRKVLHLVDRVPKEQRRRIFLADGVAKRVRQHFRALVEYCKYRELWKVFYIDHARSTPFFEAVHMHLWSRIAMAEDPLLRGIFLPTSVSTAIAASAVGFADCLSMELALNGDVEYLQSLEIEVVATTATAAPENALQVRSLSTHHRGTVYFRKLAVHRLVLWTKAIVGTNELTATDAPVFVNLLVAAAKSAIVRAVLWLILPSPAAVQEGIMVTPGGPSSLSLCDQFISSLLNLVKPTNRLERFLSFLYVAEHPLKGAVYATPAQRHANAARVLKGPSAVSADSYAKDMYWAEEMAWMDKYPEQSWELSWGEMMLLLNDTPYFSLQILLRRIHQEDQTSVFWLNLLSTLPNDIVEARFLADLNMCAVNGNHQSGSSAVTMGAHFLTFIDSRRVVELWKILQTTYLNSNAAFVEEAQNRLLFVLEHQRESPGSSAINRGGFCQTMKLLSSASSSDVANQEVKFLLPMAVWTSAALGDPTWCVLLSLLRSDEDSEASGDVPASAANALPPEHMTTFKKYLDHLAQWCVAFCGSDAPDGPAGGAFSELLSSCLGSAVLRAVFIIVEPRSDPNRTALDTDQGTEGAAERLTDLLRALNHLKDDRYLLFLLHELGHPGTTQAANGSIHFTEGAWDSESSWLWATQRSLKLLFDPQDYALLTDPAYLLFRCVSRDLRRLGEESVRGLVNKVQTSLPDIVDKPFSAHDNYLPSEGNVSVPASAPVERQHFRNLLNYALFHEMWKIIMSRLTSPSLDVGFAKSVVFATWLLVNSNANPDLSRLLLPLEADLRWQDLTYLVAVQRHAIISIAHGDRFELSRLYRTTVIPSEAVASPDDISAHNLLIDRIMKWVHNLLGGRTHRVEKPDAALFMELFTAAAANPAMRALLVMFLPAPSVVAEFLMSPRRAPVGTGANLPPPHSPVVHTAAGVVSAAELLAGAIEFVQLLVRTFRTGRWQEFRWFLIMLQHPLLGAGKVNGAELEWSKESAWITSRIDISPWQRGTSDSQQRDTVTAFAESYVAEMAWMDGHFQQNWALSWSETLSLLDDTPYFILQILLNRLRREEQRSLRWLGLLRSMPNDVVAARFQADTNMCDGLHQSAVSAVKMGAHFLTFIDTRRVVELWKIIQTTYLNSNAAFVEEAQNRLLFVLEHQRESPGNSAINRSGFCQMMTLLDTATPTEVSNLHLTFDSLLPMVIFTNVAQGDSTWRTLLSLLRPDGDREVKNVAQMSNASLLRPELMSTFKKYLDHLARWCVAFLNAEAPAGPSGGAFSEMLSSCLGSAVLRAVFIIADPRFDPNRSALEAHEDTESALERLSDLLKALDLMKDDRYLLYLLHELKHPGTTQAPNGSILFNECTWESESNWLWATQRSSQIVFDPQDYALLTDPAYLLFRYVSRDFKSIGEESVRGRVSKVQSSLPDIVDKSFFAHDNYLPCKGFVTARVGGPVKGHHFKNLTSYTLFYEMWKILMTRLPDPSVDLGFAQSVVYSTWLLVNSNANPDLSRLLLPLEADLRWQDLTYLVAVQRHAIITISRVGRFSLSQLYRATVIPPDAVASPDDLSAHNMLIDRIMKWMHNLLGGTKLRVEETDAALFMELFAAAAADPAMRALLVIFLPAPSVVAELLMSPRHAPAGALSTEGPRVSAISAAELLAGAIHFVKLIVRTFRSGRWKAFRSFLAALRHPLLGAGKSHGNEPSWELESQWITSRIDVSANDAHRAHDDTIAPTDSYVEEMAWMDGHSQQSWELSWGEMLLLLDDTPYFSLQILLHRLHRADQKSLRWLNLLRSMPNDIVVSRFQADTNMFQVNGNHLSGTSGVKMGAHFLTFIDSRRIAELWKIIQTNYLNSNAAFVEEAQNRLLSMLDHQREFPGTMHRNGFCQMMVLLDTALSEDLTTLQVTFCTVLPMAIWICAAQGDSTWCTLLSLLRPDGKREVNNSALLAAASALRPEHTITFKKYLDHLVRWCILFLNSDAPDGPAGAAFSELLSSCLGSAVLRAVFIIVEPRIDPNRTALDTDQDTEGAAERLTDLLRALNLLKDDRYLLYLLHELRHPGTTQAANGGILFTECTWESESNWLWSTQRSLQLVFDPQDYMLLTDPAYLLFRYVSKDFKNIGEENVRSRVGEVQASLPDIVDKSFLAHDNYLPCKGFVTVRTGAAVDGQHFRYLLTYALFHEMWQIVMVRLTSPSLDVGFAHAVMYSTWLLVNTNANLSLSRLLSPLESDLHWRKLTYLVAVQRYAILTISRGGQFPLSQLYRATVIPHEEEVSPDDINAHNMVIERILKWVHNLLGGRTHRVKEADAALFMELFAAAAADAAVRALLVMFLPAPSVVVEFLMSPGHSPTGPLSTEEERSANADNDTETSAAHSPAELLAGAIEFVKLVVRTFHSGRWQAFRSFLIALRHPLRDVRKANGTELEWTKESAWIASRIDIRSGLRSNREGAVNDSYVAEMAWIDERSQQSWELSWSELLLLLNDTPYFSLQILLRRMHQEDQSSLRWLNLLRSMPHGVVVTRFPVDVSLFAVDGQHHSGTSGVTMGAHFLTFIDSRRVAELWKIIQTTYLNSSAAFVEQAQNRLLFVLEHQREFLGSSAINRGGFCQMMELLESPSPPDVANVFVTFSNLLPVAIWTCEVLGDPTWRVLLSLLRPDGEREVNNSEPVLAVSALLTEHMTTFKKYLDHLARWCVVFMNGEAPDGPAGGVFSELVSACMDSAVLRAVFIILEPRCDPNRASLDSFSTMGGTAQQLSDLLRALNLLKDDRHLLYLLHELGHPGATKIRDGSILFNECKWGSESNWLWTTQRSFQLVFDPQDYALLTEPAYLLFRYVSKNFRHVQEESVRSLVDEVQVSLPDIVSKSFYAHDNYLPCRGHVKVSAGAAVEGLHFRYLLSYALFHEMWKIIMSRLTSPSLDLEFSQSVVYSTWLLVNTKANLDLSRLLLPLESDLRWRKLTYLVAVQRHAIIKISRGGQFPLSQLYRTTVIPPEAVASPDDLSAHYMLIDRIMKWVHNLLGGRTHRLKEADAALFMELFAAAAADPAVRALLVMFLPAPTVVAEFLMSPRHETGPVGPQSAEGEQATSAADSDSDAPPASHPAAQISADVVSAEKLLSGAIEFVRLLVRTFRSGRWQEFRWFLIMLQHPLLSVGKANGTELEWAAESAWITSRIDITPWKSKNGDTSRAHSAPIDPHAAQMAWVDSSSQQSWELSWGEMMLLLDDTPYFILQILLRRLQGEADQRSLRWLGLLCSMPHDVVVARFPVDVNICAENDNDLSEVSGVTMGAHFLTFIDTRRVVELWKIIQTTYLNSSAAFVEEALNSLLSALQLQRESPGNSAINRSGFCQMIELLDTATQADVTNQDVRFCNLLPMTIWTSAAQGDPTWRTLLSLLRPDGDSETSRSIPVCTAGALHPEHMTTFKKYLDHLAQWCVAFCGSVASDGPAGGAFSELLSSCLGSAVMRAVLIIVEPRCDPNRTAFEAVEVTDGPAHLTVLLRALEILKDDRYLLYLLHELRHPGTTQAANGSIQFNECTWESESNWLWATQNSLTLAFDPQDYALLANPAYLLFRFVSRDIRRLGEENVRGLVNKVQTSLPDIVEKVFPAHDNYLPCRSAVARVNAPVEGQHFRHLLTYALFHEMWKIIMARLTSPSLDLGFSQTVVYSTWLSVNSNANPDLSRLLLPLEADLYWQKLTYLEAVQRHAFITLHRDGHFAIPRLYRPIVIPPEAEVSPDDITAHNLLIDRIMKWVHNLLGGKKHRLEEADAALFMELFAAAAADVAMRAFLVTFVPAPSVVVEFLRCTGDIPCDPIDLELLDVDITTTAVQIVKLLAQTFRSDRWREFRSFLTVLQHPLIVVGKMIETEPAWTAESNWILERLQNKSAVISWQELKHVMTETPYIFLLLVNKAMSTVEQQKTAMLNIPAKYLVDNFAADSDDVTEAMVCAPHFIMMCLHEATSECALDVFQQRGMISDGFFEALLSGAVTDSTCPRLLQAFRLLQRFLYSSENRDFYRGGCIWDMATLPNISNISPVLITFLCDVSRRTDLRRDEKIIGNLILLVFQLESCSADGAVANITTLAGEWMRRDPNFVDMFFKMLDALIFPKWFSRLCWNFNRHFGNVVVPMPEPELAMDALYDEATAEQAALGSEHDSTHEDIMLDDTVPLTKHKLTMSLLGYFNLCMEFKPRALCEFVAGLGTGRPFFSFFLHKSENLTELALLSLGNILTIKQGTELYKRVHDRFLFYDNDHLTSSAVKTLGLRTSKVGSASLSLTDPEFSDLLTVAMYMHDLQKLDERFENVVISMIADQERREMVVKFMKWMMDYFVTPDVLRENNPLNTKANERYKWQHCKKFNKVSFEDVINCAAEATISSHLLRGSARSSTTVTLERLFEHYIRNSDPFAWKGLFQGSKTIAYFIKYVDVEDLNLAFSEFYKMNAQNTCFKHHLLKVRKLLTAPVVSAQDLLQLTGSGSFNDESADRFFNQLYEKAGRLPTGEVDLKMAYLLTASWMKIMKKNVLCPLPPRNAQIITLLTVASWAKSLLVKGDKRMGKALIAQVGTGEGKSLIIAMMAIYFVKVLEKRVHILENNAGLLSKDVEMMKPLFASFGIKTQHEGPGAELKPRLTWTSTEKQVSRDCRSEFCTAGVTYCLRRNLERYYQDSIMAEDYSPLANTVLIVDEVDDLIVDENPNQPYAAKDSEQPAFQAACREAQIECDLAGDQFDVGYFADGDFVRETAAEAYVKAKSMVLGVDYAIVGGKYVILIDGKPYELYDPALECLKFIRNGQPPDFSSTYYVQSIPYILSQYDCITGFSGSLGSPSEREFLAQQYKAWSFDTPSFLNTCTNIRKVPPALMDDAAYPGVPAVHVYATADEQVEKIVEMCLRLHMTVPVLVIAKSAEEAIEIETKVKAAMAEQPSYVPPVDGSKNKYIQLFRQYKLGTMTLDKENWDRIVRRATSKGPTDDRYCVTITDPFGGRGHDFDVHDDEVDRLGGLAVIMTSIPASEREWRQWKGRTARKDNKGQYAVVLCKEHSPVTAACDLLVDCALRRSNNHDAIPNLYEERLIDTLLALQDSNQLQKLTRLEKDINKGRRLNRLCDMFYQEFGSMKESTWPEGAEEVSLRKLLTDDDIAAGAITAAFNDFELEEFDSAQPVYDPPDMSSPVFWTAKDAIKWVALNAPEQEQAPGAGISPPVDAPPPPPPVVQSYFSNPMSVGAPPVIQLPAGAPAIQQPAVQSFFSNPMSGGAPPAVQSPVVPTEASAEPQEDQTATQTVDQTVRAAVSVPAPAQTPVPPLAPAPAQANPQVAARTAERQQLQMASVVRAGIAKFGAAAQQVSPSATNPLAQRRPTKILPTSDLSIMTAPASQPSQQPPQQQQQQQQQQQETAGPSPSKNSRRSQRKNQSRATEPTPVVTLASVDTESAGEQSDQEEPTQGAPDEVEDFNPNNLAIDLSALASDEEEDLLEPAVVPPPVATGPRELDADVGGLSLMCKRPAAQAKAAPVAPTSKARRQKTAKAEVQPRERTQVQTTVVEETPESRTGKQITNQLATEAVGTGKVVANTFGGAEQGTGKVVANSTGHTETSGIKAMNMVRGAAHAPEVRVLDTLCVGDTKRLTNQMGPLKEAGLYAVPGGGDALTVSVLDITGPNAGNGVAGLQVSGAITTTTKAFTMVFEVKVDPEDYQYNMLLYGNKKFEVKWRDMTLLSTTVLIKPAPKIQPRGAIAFHNAANDSKIPAGGVVVFHSRDDPRSTVEAPVFAAVSVPYTGGNIQLPPSLPADCIITVTPDIPGYSTEYSEKFVMFNGEKRTSEIMKMMLSENNLDAGEWRVVLTWGKHPRDLDLYCLTNFNPNCVYFGAKNPGGKDDPNKGNIELDIDVTGGLGPETITFTPNPAKKYRFFVRNFTGNGVTSLANSGAKIVINKGAGRPVTFEIPTDIVIDDSGSFGLFWHVFDLIEGMMVPANQVSLLDLRNVKF